MNLLTELPRRHVFVLVGVPIALVLAWIFDLMPGGRQLAEGRTGNKGFCGGRAAP